MSPTDKAILDDTLNDLRRVHALSDIAISKILLQTAERLRAASSSEIEQYLRANNLPMVIR